MDLAVDAISVDFVGKLGNLITKHQFSCYVRYGSSTLLWVLGKGLNFFDAVFPMLSQSVR